MGANQCDRIRYGATSNEDGSVRIYDTENERAWIRSDTAIDVAWQT